MLLQSLIYVFIFLFFSHSLLAGHARRANFLMIGKKSFFWLYRISLAILLIMREAKMCFTNIITENLALSHFSHFIIVLWRDVNFSFFYTYFLPLLIRQDLRLNPQKCFFSHKYTQIVTSGFANSHYQHDVK
jgi:hypothetical protein